MVAGTLTTGRGMYRNDELLVEPPVEGLVQVLGAAIQQLPTDVYVQRNTPLPDLPTRSKTMQNSAQRTVSAGPLSAGSFFVGTQGQIMQVPIRRAGRSRCCMANRVSTRSPAQWGSGWLPSSAFAMPHGKCLRPRMRHGRSRNGQPRGNGSTVSMTALWRSVGRSTKRRSPSALMAGSHGGCPILKNSVMTRMPIW